ncbi:MAG: hypothetical protein K2I95_04100, partial [Treponemataceae bacterium]|nr:hypothetical protein [Treponemataceae bacterium]
MGIVTRLISLGSLSVFGFVKGFQPVAGYSYGAKNFVRLRESIKVAVLWTTAFCAAFGLVLAIFPATIVSQFAADNAEVIRIGAAALRANGISMTLFGFYTVYSALFLAMGKGGAGFVLGSCRQGICFVPVILFLPAVCGLNGILYAQPVADVLSAAVTVCMAIPLHGKLKVFTNL